MTGEIEYQVTCYTCRGPFDAMEASWCGCLSKDRSLTCPSCLKCFCKAPLAFKQNFWIVKPIRPGLLLSTVAGRLERARFLRTLVEHDGLTGLLTHTTFLERAKRMIVDVRASGRKGGYALVMLDVDHFKKVNDTYGHPAGDRVLATLSSVLRRRLRQTDSIGRYGGEEFAILLQDLDAQQAVMLIEKLLAEFRAIEHVSPEGQKFFVTFSAGIAILSEAMDLNRWNSAADNALLAAKADGRNRVKLA